MLFRSKERTMRKADIDAAAMFRDGIPYKAGNTEVTIEWDNVYMLLHWNIIAGRPKDSLTDLTFHLPIRFQSQTTKNRVNGILDAFHFPLEVRAIKTVWHFVNLADGTKTVVQPWPNFIHR